MAQDGLEYVVLLLVLVLLLLLLLLRSWRSGLLQEALKLLRSRPYPKNALRPLSRGPEALQLSFAASPRGPQVSLRDFKLLSESLGALQRAPEALHGAPGALPEVVGPLPEVLGHPGVATPRSKAWARRLRRRCGIRARDVEVPRKRCCQDLLGREIWVREYRTP